MTKLQFKTNQARFWHAFAFLATKGKRTYQDFAIANLQACPTDEQVQAIVLEAANWKKEN